MMVNVEELELRYVGSMVKEALREEGERLGLGSSQIGIFVLEGMWVGDIENPPD